MKIRTLICDDYREMRVVLRRLLDGIPDIEVVGEAETGIEAVQLARELHPDVVLMDVAMPKMDGIEATRQIVANVNGTKVIGLTVHKDRCYVEPMREAGAHRILIKGCALKEIVEAIHAVVSETPASEPPSEQGGGERA